MVLKLNTLNKRISNSLFTKKNIQAKLEDELKSIKTESELVQSKFQETFINAERFSNEIKEMLKICDKKD